MIKATFFKNALLLLTITAFGMAVLTSCGGGGTQYEEVEVPTQGLITTIVEVQPEEYKIEDEVPIPDTSQSLIIAKYLDGGVDTFTLAEVRLLRETGYNGPRSGVFTAASYGFFGYMIGRSMMGGFRPSASAYRDPNTYNRVNNTTGNTIRSTSQRVSRPSSRSRSGYGSGSSRSSRSYGG